MTKNYIPNIDRGSYTGLKQAVQIVSFLLAMRTVFVSRLTMLLYLVCIRNPWLHEGEYMQIAKPNHHP